MPASAYPLLLDAAALSELALPGKAGPPQHLRSLLAEAWRRDRAVLVPAVVCAEVARGRARQSAIEALLRRHDVSRGQRSPVRVVPTDFDLARRVGTVLHAARAGSEDLVDAHLVAICIEHGGGLVVTSDPGDVARLGAPFPGLRLVVSGVRSG